MWCIDLFTPSRKSMKPSTYRIFMRCRKVETFALGAETAAMISLIAQRNVSRNGSGTHPHLDKQDAKPLQPPPPKPKKTGEPPTLASLSTLTVSSTQTATTSHAPRPTAYAAPLLTRERTYPKPL